MKGITLLHTLLLILSCNTSQGQFWKVSEAERLSSDINTSAEESIPVFLKSANSLYFVRTFDPSNKGGMNDQDIWYSEDINGEFQPAQNLPGLNNKLNNAVLGFSSEGDKIYLLDAYGGKSDLVKGVSYASRTDKFWGDPIELVIPGLSISGNFYGFHMNNSEDALIISYNGPQSLGEEDLYLSLKVNGEWSTPVHMGLNLNTSGFEIAPFLTASNDTLFFTSSGHPGMGNGDIFYSVRQNNDWLNWTKPRALDKPFNSDGFDAYFTLNEGVAYWSSDREQENSDIFKAVIFTPPPLNATCFASPRTKRDECDGNVRVEVSSGAGTYYYRWNNGYSSNNVENLCEGIYTVEVSDGYNQSVILSCEVEYVLPISPVVVRDFNNLDWIHYFKYNKNKLNITDRELRKMLKEIEDQLNNGRTSVNLLIQSSASHVPTKSFNSNEDLAKLRAENLKYDLITYFEKCGLSTKVNVSVGSVKVDGPTYENDASNREKYEPFQFVSIRTE